MWKQVCAISKTQISKTFPINYEFTSQELIVSATSKTANTTWKKAGYLQPVFLIPQIGQVKAKRKSLTIGTQTINFENIPLPYFLEFEFLSWFLDIDLSIWINPSMLLANTLIQQSLDRIEYKIDNQFTT